LKCSRSESRGNAVAQLTPSIVTKRNDTAIASQDECMSLACGNSYGPTNRYQLSRSVSTCRTITKLTRDIRTPGEYGSIILQSNSVRSASRNRFDIARRENLDGQVTLRIRAIAELSIAVCPPGPKAAVGFDCVTRISARSDCNYPRESADLNRAISLDRSAITQLA
jgi:hypothetical protein